MKSIRDPPNIKNTQKYTVVLNISMKLWEFHQMSSFTQNTRISLIFNEIYRRSTKYQETLKNIRIFVIHTNLTSICCIDTNKYWLN